MRGCDAGMGRDVAEAVRVLVANGAVPGDFEALVALPEIFAADLHCPSNPKASCSFWQRSVASYVIGFLKELGKTPGTFGTHSASTSSLYFSYASHFLQRLALDPKTPRLVSVRRSLPRRGRAAPRRFLSRSLTRSRRSWTTGSRSTCATYSSRVPGSTSRQRRSRRSSTRRGARRRSSAVHCKIYVFESK